MIQIGRKEFGINGFAIRLLAIIAMVAAAIGYLKGADYAWLEAFGWTSFTMFAFLLSEGLAHTTKLNLYYRRFILFTAISQVVYSYYRTKTFWSWKHFSVMATLLLGLIVITIIKYIHKRFDNIVLDMIAIAALGYGSYFLANTYDFDFGGYGIIIIITMFVARAVTYTKLTQIIVLFYIGFFLTSNVLTIVNIAGLQYPLAPELYSMIALPFIWLYDDTRGPNSLPLQVCQYAAYPIFVLILTIFKLKF